jgi:MFS transporter, DHA1 family, tetracycline resistance protein
MSTENENFNASGKKKRQAALIFIFITVLLDVLSLGVTIPVLPQLIKDFTDTKATGYLVKGNSQAGDTIEVEGGTIAFRKDHEITFAGVYAVDPITKAATNKLQPFAIVADTGPAVSALKLNPPLIASGTNQNVSSLPADKTSVHTVDYALATRYYGLFVTVWAMMQFIFSPILGALSDRFGRRRVILLSCAGLGLDYILMAWAPSLVWLFIGRVLSGITAASFAAAAAYIADITPPEKRAASYGLFGAAWGLGFVIGPALGGILGAYHLRLPFWVAAALTLLNAAYGLFILPESLPEQNRSAFSFRKANPIGSLKLLRSHPQLLGLAGILFLYQLAHQVFQSVFVLYADYRYGWDERTVGLTLMCVGLMGVIVQGFLVRRTAPLLGERRMLFIALTFGAVGYFIYGVAQTGWVFWSAIPVFSLVGYFSAAIQGLMTRRVSPSEQGQLQGANSSLMGISGMAGPYLFTNLFAFAIAKDAGFDIPGLPFIVAASLHLVAIGLAFIIVKRPGPAVEVSSS